MIGKRELPPSDKLESAVPNLQPAVRNSQSALRKPCSILLLALIAAALVAAGSIWRIATALPRDAQINPGSGSWVSVAMDFADGTFYRPLLTAHAPWGDGGAEYGGTRFFPLHFALQGLLIRAGMDPIRAGYPITLAATAGLVAGVYFLLRQFGLGRAWSAAVSVLALSTTAMQYAITTVRGDLLSAALDVWGVAFAARWMNQPPARWAPQQRRTARCGVCAAVFFALAFIGKETTLFGFAAAVAALLLAGKRREAGRFAFLAAGVMAVLFLAACVFSQGRIVSNLVGCGAGGMTLASILHAPRMNYFIFMRDPIGMFFLVLALGALLGSGRAVWKSLPALWFIAAAGAAVAIVASPGISYNHFIDAQVAAIVFLAILAGQPAEERDGGDESWRRIGACTLALTAALSLGHALYELRGQDIEPRRSQLREVFAVAAVSGKPILAEDNTLLVANGVRPVMLDPFNFRILQMKDSAFSDALRRDLENHRFGAVVLRSDPRTPDGRAWLRDMNFGPGFADNLLRTYSFSTGLYGYLIFVPN